MGYLRWQGNDKVLVIIDRKPAYVLKINKNGICTKLRYKRKRVKPN